VRGFPDSCVFRTLHLQFATTGWDVGQYGYGLSTKVPYLCTIKFYSFVLIAYWIAEMHRNLLAHIEYFCTRNFLYAFQQVIVMILSVHMHPKPSFTLFCKQIYYLEMIQLDSKFFTCFLYTCNRLCLVLNSSEDQSRNILYHRPGILPGGHKQRSSMVVDVLVSQQLKSANEDSHFQLN